MKIRIIYISSLIFILISCKPGKMEITGSIRNAPGDSVYLIEIKKESFENFSSALIQNDGSFVIREKMDASKIFLLRTHKEKYITLAIHPGEQLIFTADAEDLPGSYNVSGSEDSEKLLSIQRKFIFYARSIDSLYKELNRSGSNQEFYKRQTFLQKRYNSFSKDYKNYLEKFIVNNPESLASLMALSQKFFNQSVFTLDQDFDLFEQLDNSLYDRYPENEQVQKLHEYVQAFQNNMGASGYSGEDLIIGDMAPEICLPGPDNQTISLSDFEGEYVLLDFWAAWCVPCLRENQVLKSLYNEYHELGFNIFQVSLDRSKNEWLETIERDGLIWNHGSDLKYFNSEAAKTYQVKAIPMNYLINPQGKIEAKNLHGNALKNELKRIFKK